MKLQKIVTFGRSRQMSGSLPSSQRISSCASFWRPVYLSCHYAGGQHALWTPREDGGRRHLQRKLAAGVSGSYSVLLLSCPFPWQKLLWRGWFRHRGVFFRHHLVLRYVTLFWNGSYYCILTKVNKWCRCGWISLSFNNLGNIYLVLSIFTLLSW